MIRLGVTGNIACGKGLVTTILSQDLHCPVIDSDEVVHELLATPNPVSEAVRELCAPRDISGTDSHTNYLDRRKLGQIAFSDPKLRQRLEEIIHPAVSEEVERFFEAHAEYPVVANAIPLLFETGSQKRFDEVWLVYCGPDIQRQRLRARNPDLSDRELERRLEAQMPQGQKLPLADRTIDNSGSIESTREQVQRAWELLSRTTQR